MKLLLPTFLLLCSQLAAASGGGGNGGGVHFCTKRTQQELYDVYEGKARYGLSLDESKSFDETLVTALTKVRTQNFQLSLRLKMMIDKIKDPAFMMISKDLDLITVKDAHVLMKRQGCSYKQLANWDDRTDRLFVNGTIYKTLSGFHRAAFIIHEAIYKLDRLQNNAQDSDRSRQIVAEILSTRKKSEALNELRLDSDVIALEAGPEPLLIEGNGKFMIHLGAVDLSMDEVLIRLASFDEISQSTESVETEISSSRYFSPMSLVVPPASQDHNVDVEVWVNGVIRRRMKATAPTGKDFTIKNASFDLRSHT